MYDTISVSNSLIHSFEPTCIIDGIWNKSFSLIKFAIAEFLISISFAKTSPVQSSLFNNLCEKTAIKESANCNLICSLSSHEKLSIILVIV
jgi:hypothetical protein